MSTAKKACGEKKQEYLRQAVEKWRERYLSGKPPRTEIPNTPEAYERDLKSYFYGLEPPSNLPTSVTKDLQGLAWSIVALIRVLSDDPNDLAFFIEKRNRGLARIENEKSLISGVFLVTWNYMTEKAPRFLDHAYMVRRRQELLDVFDRFVWIGNTVSKDEKHKSRKGRFGHLNEQTLCRLRNTLSNWTDSLIKNIKQQGIKDTPTQKRYGSRREQFFVDLLYQCFEKSSPRLHKTDIYYNIAKITLVMGIGKHGKVSKGNITEQLISTEANRVGRMIRRLTPRPKVRLVSKEEYRQKYGRS